MVPLSKFDLSQCLFPNSLVVLHVEQMGIVLNLCLHKNVFNLDDPVLKFALQHSLSKPSDFWGYHLLHYLLSYALQQSLSINSLPTFAEFPNLYDFSSANLDWEEREAIATIPCCYDKHCLLDHFLRSLPQDSYCSANHMLQQVLGSCISGTSLPSLLTIAALPDTLSWFI